MSPLMQDLRTEAPSLNLISSTRNQSLLLAAMTETVSQIPESAESDHTLVIVHQDGTRVTRDRRTGDAVMERPQQLTRFGLPRKEIVYANGCRYQFFQDGGWRKLDEKGRVTMYSRAKDRRITVLSN